MFRPQQDSSSASETVGRGRSWPGVGPPRESHDSGRQGGKPGDVVTTRPPTCEACKMNPPSRGRNRPEKIARASHAPKKGPRLRRQPAGATDRPQGFFAVRGRPPRARTSVSPTGPIAEGLVRRTVGLANPGSSRFRRWWSASTGHATSGSVAQQLGWGQGAGSPAGEVHGGPQVGDARCASSEPPANPARLPFFGVSFCFRKQTVLSGRERKVRGVFRPSGLTSRHVDLPPAGPRRGLKPGPTHGGFAEFIGSGRVDPGRRRGAGRRSGCAITAQQRCEDGSPFRPRCPGLRAAICPVARKVPPADFAPGTVRCTNGSARRAGWATPPPPSALRWGSHWFVGAQPWLCPRGSRPASGLRQQGAPSGRVSRGSL